MHVALINQFYPPSRAPTGLLLSDLAETLCRRGHRVTVVTSPGVYGGADHGEGTVGMEGVTVFRVGPDGRHRTGPAWKLFDYIRFFPGAYRALLRRDPLPDAVVCMTTPPFCGLIASRLRRKHGVPYLLWCMDLYPEALVSNGWMNPSSLPYRLLSTVTRRERNDAAGIVALGPDMAERIRGAVPDAPVVEIPVWSRLKPDAASRKAALSLRRRRGWDDRDIVLLYSGHMGRAHAIDGFVQFAERIKKSDQGSGFRFVFCGSGPSAAAWRRAGGSLFEWIDPVGSADLVPHLLSADIHLISQQRAWTGIVVPSKFQAACALGRPVLFAGPVDSAAARWISTADCGWVIPPGDESALESAIREVGDPLLISEKGARAAAQSTRFFSPDENSVQLAQLVEKIGLSGV